MIDKLNSCPFCAEVDLWETIERQNIKDGSPIRNVYNAALVVRYQKEGVPGVHGSIIGQNHPLVFCPVCGRQKIMLSGRKEPDNEHQEND